MSVESGLRARWGALSWNPYSDPLPTGGAYHRAIRRLPPTFQPISGRGGGWVWGGVWPAEGEGLHSRGSPKKRETKSELAGPTSGQKCYITHAFLGIPKERGTKSELDA